MVHMYVGEQEADGEEGEQPPHERQRRVLWSLEDYDENVNAAADVFTMTAGGAALESALPSTVRVVGEGYVSVPYDHTELAAAVGGDGLATFFENVEVRILNESTEYGLFFFVVRFLRSCFRCRA